MNNKAEYGFKKIQTEQTGMQPTIKLMNRIYLAIPYTFNPERSFEIANKVAADLMQKGNLVFSPISHSHRIADHMDPSLRISQEFWMKQDLPMVEWCHEVHVVCIGEYGADLIENSKGVQTEIKTAKQLNKPIKIIDYYE